MILPPPLSAPLPLPLGRRAVPKRGQEKKRREKKRGLRQERTRQDERISMLVVPFVTAQVCIRSISPQTRRQQMDDLTGKSPCQTTPQMEGNHT